jgi:hypothetical protein
MRRAEKSLLVLLVLSGALVWMSACATAGLFGFSGDSWKEEVLLHDGSKMVITRSQTYGGQREVGQLPPIKEHTITFTLPGSDKRVTWISEYGEDIKRTNFYLLAVHVLNGIPYIVAEPNLCLSYNKWGRPNPPYVFFKYKGKAWQRIPLGEFPAEFKTINVALDILGRDVEALVNLGFVSSEKIKELNHHVTRPQYKTILREAYPGAAGGCTEMIRTNDGWEGIGFFKSQPSYEACSKYCGRKGVDQQNCPCKNLFREK